MPTAWITLRHDPPYRSGSFQQGFECLGFKTALRHPAPGEVAAEDVVVVWNLTPRYRHAAETATKAGAALIVTENGYIGRRGDAQPFYALARDGHNGSGFWYVGKEDRWGELGHALHNWREPEGYILIACQRGIGSEIMKSPFGFEEAISDKIRRILNRAGMHRVDIRMREHPGRHVPLRSLRDDLAGARAVVTWASNVVNLAVVAGIPSFRCAPYHVNDAVLSNLEQIIDPSKPDREPALHRLAWAQWSLSEISDGSAFQSILRDRLT